MDQHVMLEAVDRYLRDEMSETERSAFDAMRKDSPELDQMVVEHHYFVGQMDTYADRKKFKATLNDIHHNLQESGDLKNASPVGKGRVIELWNRYRRVITVAASIAGITALMISGLTSLFSPKAPIREVEELRRKVTRLEKETSTQGAEINAVRNKIDPSAAVKFGGTSFLIDPKGYLITSAHVVEDASGIFVQNNAGDDFRATIVHTDMQKDLAILRIDDEDFKARSPLPYGISKSATELSEAVFTLGYPKDEIVYGEGYLSAKSGLKGDTMSYQISISANPGNSGGPVLNKKGEVIGILNARQTQAEGVVFAIRSKNIFRVVDELKSKDSSMAIRLPTQSSMKATDRAQQVRRMQDCIYMVKVVL
jgi:serine protease Do